MTKLFSILSVVLVLAFVISPITAGNADPISQEDSAEVTNNSSKTDDNTLGITGIVTVALIGLISGVIGTIFAPWVNWGIEKRRLKHTRKVELTKEWRIFIHNFDFETENFGNSTVYGAMRPFMDENIVKNFEAERTVFVPPDGGRGDQLFKQWASDQVAMIEKKWKLL